MASRRFFAYDPYDYYYTTPYEYPYPYYHHQKASNRSAGGFFPAAADAEPAPVRAAARPEVRSSRTVRIPVHVDGPDSEPERETARGPAAVPRRRAPSEEAAAVRLQAAARGFLARRAVREVEREAEEVAGRVAREAEALRADARARIAVEEALMRLLLRLDAVRGARDYRKRVTKRVLAVQDAVDALEPRPAPAPTVVVEEAGAADVSAAVEMGEGSEMAPELPDAAGHGGETDPKTEAEMEVDEGRAPCEQDSAKETELVEDGANLGADETEDADAEGEWEMVEEPAPAEAVATLEAPRQEPAGEEIRKTTEAGATADGLDARKVMEMMAALCEQNAQQCAVIGALAERVDALERAVRRVEDAERRRRRANKLRKEGKESNHSKCYSNQGISDSN